MLYFLKLNLTFCLTFNLALVSVLAVAAHILMRYEACLKFQPQIVRQDPGVAPFIAVRVIGIHVETAQPSVRRGQRGNDR